MDYDKAVEMHELSRDEQVRLGLFLDITPPSYQDEHGVTYPMLTNEMRRKLTHVRSCHELNTGAA